MRRHLSDVRETVWRLDYLAGPPVRQRDLWHAGSERVFETVVTRVCVGGLTRLVILATKNHEVVIGMRGQPQIVIGLGRVPKEGVRDGPPRNPTRDHVG